MEKVLKTASPTATSTDIAIVDAMISPYPKTRYVVANVLGIPANVIMPLLAQLPDRVADVMFYYATQKGYGGLIPLFVCGYLLYVTLLLYTWKFINYVDSKLF